MSKGIYLAQNAHIAPLIPPIDVTGGKTGVAFSMKNHAHASILLQVGASAAAFTKIIANACTDSTGANPTAIPFDIFTAETLNGDVLSARTPVTAAGYTPSAVDDIFYVIEFDASHLPQGSPYVQLQLTNGTNSVLASSFVILTGARYATDQSPTVFA